MPCQPVSVVATARRRRRGAGPAAGEDGEQAFDLNIEKVLEHWSVPFAIRELIANALDEQVLTAPLSRWSSRTPRETGISLTAAAACAMST
jgi:hypothetical protein